MPVVAAIAVLMFFSGVFVIGLGWTGYSISTTKKREGDGFTFSRERRLRLLVSLALGIFAAAVTGWYGLMIGVTAIAYGLGGLYADRRVRQARLDRLRAVATWLEMMRDTIVTGAGISSAVRMTAKRAPELIGPEVRRFGTRLESASFGAAIVQFGDELNVPEADGGIAALATASRSAGGNLGQLLSEVVNSMRDQVDQRSRIEALRVRFVTSASLMVAVTLATSVIFLATSSQLRTPYNSAIGQIVLMLIGGLYAASIGVLRRMGREKQPVRILAGAAT